MLVSDNDDKEYKPTDNAFTREIRSDLEHNMDKFRDPVVLGEMVFRLLEERENTNRLLKNILQKLDLIEAKMGPLEAQPVIEQPLLPEIDEQILNFVKEKGKATAEHVRVKFKYKGKNAASARLNKLCSMGLLKKKQAGKKVYFFPL
jgi:predicted HTH transcriptional regulator